MIYKIENTSSCPSMIKSTIYRPNTPCLEMKKKESKTKIGNFPLQIESKLTSIEKASLNLEQKLMDLKYKFINVQSRFKTYLEKPLPSNEFVKTDKPKLLNLWAPINS